MIPSLLVLLPRCNFTILCLSLPKGKPKIIKNKCQKHDHFLMENQQVERMKVEVRHSKCHIRQEVIPATLGLLHGKYVRMCRMELQGRMSKYRSDFNVRANVRKYAGKDPNYSASKHGRMHVSINVYSSMQRKKNVGIFAHHRACQRNFLAAITRNSLGRHWFPLRSQRAGDFSKIPGTILRNHHAATHFYGVSS